MPRAGGWGLMTKEHKKNLGSNGNVLHFDSGSGYMGIDFFKTHRNVHLKTNKVYIMEIIPQ